jgi:NAD(P)-dependent dehydrogenase (short-subunit alcohol dehydrogenase family)
MRFDMRAVESHSFRRFSRFGRRLEDALPNSLRTPAVEAIVDRLGRRAPDDIAAVALFLASDESTAMSGSEIFADGGTAQV